MDKVSISGGKIINAGVTFARGIKDTPLYLKRAMAYEQEIHDAGNVQVVLYDMADKRAWLVDGACALLHLTCTQTFDSMVPQKQSVSAGAVPLRQF